MASEEYTTLFGEKIDVIAETDGLYLQLTHILMRNKDFEDALDKGELTEPAVKAIAGAFEAVFERNRRLANIILSDKKAQEELTRFWFARCYAEVQAHVAYGEAFKRAQAIT